MWKAICMSAVCILSANWIVHIVHAETGTNSKTEATSKEKVMKEIEGTWRIVDGVNQGKPLVKSEYEKHRVIVSENMIAVIDGKEAELYKAEFKLDVSSEPFKIDMIANMPNSPAQEAKGIIKLEKNGWVLCYGLNGDRPKDFESKVNEPTMLFYMSQVPDPK